MLKPARDYPSFRAVVERGELVRVVGAHSALAAALAEQAGFPAVWASSLEISAMRALPDASLLSMNEYLRAASEMQKALAIPVVADCDTGFGNNLNVAHMVHEYEDAGITAVCIEDKAFPKMNSFSGSRHELVDVGTFCSKLTVAKNTQRTPDFFVIGRTEALISGIGVDEALRRCEAYEDAGADAVLVHSKWPTNKEVLEFLQVWRRKCPVVIVPTTYPKWNADEAFRAGVSVIIYANHALRTLISALQETYRVILREGNTLGLESRIATLHDVFELQRLEEWKSLQP
jgi:phosphoenolpyruvate phosphomutase